eukprot:SAG11_NODE_1029_length_6121_cov_24.347891_4_plen_146_part_00
MMNQFQCCMAESSGDERPFPMNLAGKEGGSPRKKHCGSIGSAIFMMDEPGQTNSTSGATEIAAAEPASETRESAMQCDSPTGTSSGPPELRGGGSREVDPKKARAAGADSKFRQQLDKISHSIQQAGFQNVATLQECEHWVDVAK